MPGTRADILDSPLAFHLAAVADFVVATDHRSQDGTTDILRRYEGEGVLRLIRVGDEAYRQAEWETRWPAWPPSSMGPTG